MTRLEALKELVEKVEAGTIDGYAFEFAEPLGAYAQHALQACFGSLDAALALHEAVLPGWGWELYDDDGARVWPRPLGDPLFTTAPSGTPARAWLLAILKALIAQEEAQ